MHFKYKFGRTNSGLNDLKSIYGVDMHFIIQEIWLKYSIEWKASDVWPIYASLKKAKHCVAVTNRVRSMMDSRSF